MTARRAKDELAGAVEPRVVAAVKLERMKTDAGGNLGAVFSR
jgi:hypothetical protein